jgi:hypothetical protein
VAKQLATRNKFEHIPLITYGNLSRTQSVGTNALRAAAIRLGIKTSRQGNGRELLSIEEVQVIQAERSFDSAERIKLTLRAAYKSFQLPSVPEFGDEGWQHAQTLIEKRDRLMHPKSVEDLEVPDALWADIHEGTKWLFRQLFGFMEQLAIVHGLNNGH